MGMVWRAARGASLWVGLLIGVAGCVTVDYVGKSYPPTTSVEIYLSADDVQRAYETIGEARAQVGALPFANPGQQLQEKLVAEARARGADAIILGQLDTRQVSQVQQTTGQATTKQKGNTRTTEYTDTSTTSVEEINELRATLIRYER